MIKKLICFALGHQWLRVHKILPDFESHSLLCSRCGHEKILNAEFTFVIDEEEDAQ